MWTQTFLVLKCLHEVFNIKNKLLLFKKRKVDKELWNINNILEAEVILTSKQRIETFGLKGHFKYFVTKRQRVRRLQTFTAEEQKKKKMERRGSDIVILN